MGEIVRNARDIYFRHFWLFTRIYFIPIIPVAIVLHFVKQPVFFAMATGLDLLVTLAVIPAITVAMSHICLGVKPGFVTSYRRMFNRVGGFLTTYWLLVLLAISVVTLLTALLLMLPSARTSGIFIAFLLVFGILFFTGTMFTLQVSVLEPLFGLKAIKRSIMLGRGCYLRNAATLLLLMIVITTCVILSVIPIAYNEGPAELVRVVTTILVHGLVPYCFVGIVLLYWDMRVRKEAYDSAVLAEELRE